MTLQQNKIGLSRSFPTKMAEGEIRLALTPGQPLRLFAQAFGRKQSIAFTESMPLAGGARNLMTGTLYARKIKADEVWARTGNGLKLYDDSGTVGIFVKDGGQVGIGTTLPWAKFHALAASGSTLLGAFTNNDFVDGATGSGLAIQSLASSGDTGIKIRALDAGFASVALLQLGNTLNVAADGNVGIGVTDPDVKLEVAGDIKVNSANFALEGYGAGRNILRSGELQITPGATPGTDIDIGHTNRFNSPSVTNADDLAAGASNGSFDLSADGKTVSFNITAAIVGTLGETIVTHDINSSSTSEMYFVITFITGGNLGMRIRKRGSNADVSWLTLIDSGDDFRVHITYITSS